MADQPWNQSMSDEQFEFMRAILGAPSPVGLEASMTHGVIVPFFEKIKQESWGIHTFKGNASVVLDTHPGRDDMLTVMFIGHADKIRMQVRSIGEDGKIWINSDSFIPNVLIGHEVLLFSQKPEEPGQWRVLRGGTVEALGAIHFADMDTRSGKKGVTKKQLYLELQMHGERRKEQVEQLGIRPGDPIIFDRKIKRGFSPDTFYGAYLDNGLGCYATCEAARLYAEKPLEGVRALFAIATHEEIGRMGSRVIAGALKPDVLIGLDVNHDYDSAPNIGDRRMTPLKMGGGFSLTTGAITSEYLNALIERAARKADIPYQKSVSGRDTGTDGMAGFFAAIDAASTSVGFPIRNMHTISETGHTGDVIAAAHGMYEMMATMQEEGTTADSFRTGHARLDGLEEIVHQPLPADEDED